MGGGKVTPAMVEDFGREGYRFGGLNGGKLAAWELWEISRNMPGFYKDYSPDLDFNDNGYGKQQSLHYHDEEKVTVEDVCEDYKEKTCYTQKEEICKNELFNKLDIEYYKAGHQTEVQLQVKSKSDKLSFKEQHMQKQHNFKEQHMQKPDKYYRADHQIKVQS